MQLFLTPTYRCYMCYIERIVKIASEEMSFENIDRWMDGRRMPAYTISSPMRLGSGELKIQRERRAITNHVMQDIHITLSFWIRGATRGSDTTYSAGSTTLCSLQSHETNQKQLAFYIYYIASTYNTT